MNRQTYFDVAVRYICGGDKHPDHDTICSFRLKNRDVFKESFIKVLMVASEIGNLKKVGGISVDGTKISANASKHSAVSYKRAVKKIKQLELEIEQLTQKAEEADSTPLLDGLTIPDEISRRENRKKALEKAKAAIEERYEEIYKEKNELNMKRKRINGIKSVKVVINHGEENPNHLGRHRLIICSSILQMKKVK